jgi:hypothetical protein
MRVLAEILCKVIAVVADSFELAAPNEWQIED